MGLCPRVGLVHELDLWWDTGVVSAARGWPSLVTPTGEPQIEGPDCCPPTIILEMKQKTMYGASPRVAPAHLRAFRQDAAPPEAKEAAACAGCVQSSVKAAPELNCIWEVPRLLFHSLNPWNDVYVSFSFSLHPAPSHLQMIHRPLARGS